MVTLQGWALFGVVMGSMFAGFSVLFLIFWLVFVNLWKKQIAEARVDAEAAYEL